jgi:hypothetical protein
VWLIEDKFRYRAGTGTTDAYWTPERERTLGELFATWAWEDMEWPERQ